MCPECMPGVRPLSTTRVCARCLTGMRAQTAPGLRKMPTRSVCAMLAYLQHSELSAHASTARAGRNAASVNISSFFNINDLGCNRKRAERLARGAERLGSAHDGRRRRSARNMAPNARPMARLPAILIWGNRWSKPIRAVSTASPDLVEPLADPISNMAERSPRLGCVAYALRPTP